MPSLIPKHDAESVPAHAKPVLSETERRFVRLPRPLRKIEAAPASLKGYLALSALLEQFVAAMAKAHCQIDEAALAALEQAGYDLQQVLEVIFGIGMKTLARCSDQIPISSIPSPSGRSSRP